MQIMLIQKVHNLGGIGDRVEVKPGYARNYLLPKGFAVRINKENLEAFEAKRAELEKVAMALEAEAKARAEVINKLDTIIVTARVATEGKLYGSISIPDIIKAVGRAGVKIESREVCMPEGTIRTLGEYPITLQLEGDVTADIKIKVEPEAG